MCGTAEGVESKGSNVFNENAMTCACGTGLLSRTWIEHAPDGLGIACLAFAGEKTRTTSRLVETSRNGPNGPTRKQNGTPNRSRGIPDERAGRIARNALFTYAAGSSDAITVTFRVQSPHALPEATVGRAGGFFRINQSVVVPRTV